MSITDHSHVQNVSSPAGHMYTSSVLCTTDGRTYFAGDGTHLKRNNSHISPSVFTRVRQIDGIMQCLVLTLIIEVIVPAYTVKRQGFTCRRLDINLKLLLVKE